MGAVRRGFTAFLILMLVVVTAASGKDYAFHWGVALISLVMLFLADLMFFTEADFQFDPFYQNWAKRTDPNY
ncbi:unnamed protein product [Vitrella brassicaformis CCMP3155]|uniref:Uncharacterized protein n=1 Tax=Vitrella brassicaformis (strain CCMP3155) TaxID=1169540 RepID=A0A0G4E8G0_VITBC|nr:unnamed protein product [Vitrella brassicaformis CCMP3155]|eukprot:CEL91761.1 unnamed protein product [Vitrella brassicaformis CCMP3155]